MYDIFDPELRITFDTNIRWRDREIELEAGDSGDVMMGEDSYIMEIKIGEAMPVWLADILDELKIYPASYSKYGTCYCNYLSKGIHSEEETVGGNYCA
jgi:hypothetical protein